MSKNGYKQCPTRGTIYIMLQKQAIFKFVTLSHCATVSFMGVEVKTLCSPWRFMLTYMRRAGAENQQAFYISVAYVESFHIFHLNFLVQQQQTTRGLEEIMCRLNYPVLLPTNTAGTRADVLLKCTVL